MSLDKDTVRTIARLARIRIDDKSLEPLVGELNNIIGWVEQLSEINTDGVAAMTGVGETNNEWRKDVVTDGDCQDKVLQNAPDSEGPFFAVPKVIE